MASIDLGYDGYKFGLWFVYFDRILTEHIMWLPLVRNSQFMVKLSQWKLLE